MGHLHDALSRAAALGMTSRPRWWTRMIFDG